MVSLHNDLLQYLSKITNSGFNTYLGKNGGYVTFENSGKRGLKAFTLSLESLLLGLSDIDTNSEKFRDHENYLEDDWRELPSIYFSDLALKSTIGVQTKPVFVTLSKLISWANNKPHNNDNHIDLDDKSLAIAKEKLHELIYEYRPKKTQPEFKVSNSNSVILPKPFVLLSGISGTGKTRFVKEQAKRFREDGSNYCIVPVRPDWHEPSDLLGYISRLGNSGSEYIVTDFLQFIVAAWKEICASVESGEIHYKEDCVPYWLCLDEMNLAPVEQYFADYLTIIETRYWEEGQYHCDALLNPSIFPQVENQAQLRTQLNLAEEENDKLWDYFLNKGISIPPNLIIAGTVNMDETTHGFSRKVIDRAFTIDFGEFFPNDYQAYFAAQTQAKTLSFPRYSQVNLSLIAEYDPDGSQSIGFLEAINSVLKTTPFELAYRALNELLIAVVCFMPKEKMELQAVWDDFLMTKVLPRIEGDSEKLQDDDDNSLLNQLELVLAEQLNDIWHDPESRPDLLREQIDGGSIHISCRSKKKLNWMKVRLSTNGFTSFWP